MNRMGGRHDGLRARAADAVDSHRRDVNWKSTIHGRLPGRVHLVAGLCPLRIRADVRFSVYQAQSQLLL